MSFIKQRFFQYLCICLLIYSLIGGLLIPLSPNIEKLSYEERDSSLIFAVSLPKLERNEIERFYLKRNDLKEGIILPSVHVDSTKDGVQIDFFQPKYYQGMEKGNSFDLLCETKKHGILHYFGAYYLDSTLSTVPLIETHELKEKEVPFHLSFPNRNILQESIRNLFYHVPLWFTMIGLLFYSLIQSILYLSKSNIENDIKASQSAKVALIFGTLGIFTGMVWAKYTWGAFWTNDPKLNGAAIGMLSYFAYFILRGSVEDEVKRAKLSAVYNIFSFTIYMVFIMILPRLNDSLHPGNGGNPGFNIYEQDNVMRLFFYPAVLGWGMLGFWLTEIYVYLRRKEISTS